MNWNKWTFKLKKPHFLLLLQRLYRFIHIITVCCRYKTTVFTKTKLLIKSFFNLSVLLKEYREKHERCCVAKQVDTFIYSKWRKQSQDRWRKWLRMPWKSKKVKVEQVLKEKSLPLTIFPQLLQVFFIQAFLEEIFLHSSQVNLRVIFPIDVS